jgi:hypothetical protein
MPDQDEDVQAGARELAKDLLLKHMEEVQAAGPVALVELARNTHECSFDTSQPTEQLRQEMLQELSRQLDAYYTEETSSSVH